LADFLGNYSLDLFDIVYLLAFEIAPQILKLRPVLSVGNVLVVAPNSVQSPTQVVHKIVIVISASASFADVLHYSLCWEGHDAPPIWMNPVLQTKDGAKQMPTG
jgi:hypothetical protein